MFFVLNLGQKVVIFTGSGNTDIDNCSSMLKIECHECSAVNGTSISNSSTQAQGIMWKRGQKEGKGHRMRRAAVISFPLDNRRVAYMYLDQLWSPTQHQAILKFLHGEGRASETLSLAE